MASTKPLGKQQVIEIRPLTGALGAEVLGANVTNLSDGEFELIHTAFLEHSVLVFRDQQITQEEFAAFGQRSARVPGLDHRTHEGLGAQRGSSDARAGPWPARPAHRVFQRDGR